MRLGRLMRPMRLLGLIGPMGPIGLMGLMGLGLMGLGLVGCSDDDETGADYVTVEAQSCSTSFVELGEDSQSRDYALGTRTWTPPTGYAIYTPFFVGQKDLTYKSIFAFFTNGSVSQQGTFFYKPHSEVPRWRLNNVELESGTYQVYGYIPKEDADNASIEPLNNDYSNGAVLTINGLSTVTTSDVCVIVGAKDGTGSNNTFNEDQPYTVAGLAPGKFDVQFAAGQGVKNFIFLLFDHLYSSLRFGFTVDPIYNELRTIVVKKLELVACANASGVPDKAKHNATITLQCNENETSPIVGDITYTADATSANAAYTTIYEGETTLSTNAPTQFMGGFAPGITIFKLRTTYDVYDKNQVRNSDGTLKFDSNGNPVYNLVRQNCEAENMIDLNKKFPNASSVIKHGDCFQYTITVQPTFLYVMSEPDLDNPTFVNDSGGDKSKN